MNEGNFNSEERAIREIEEQERQAVLNQDIGSLERLWAKGLIVNNPQNQISMGRDDVLALIKQGFISYTAFERKIELIRFDADIAIIMGKEIVELTGNSPRAGSTAERRFTNIWRKQNGEWLMIARHANFIAPSSK